jgi:hypothetical protein
MLCISRDFFILPPGYQTTPLSGTFSVILRPRSIISAHETCKSDITSHESSAEVPLKPIRARQTDLEFAATSEIIDAFLGLLVSDKIPRYREDAVHRDIHWHIVRVTVLVAVHRPDHTLTGTYQQTCRPIYIVCPARHRLLPYWDHYTRSIKHNIHLYLYTYIAFFKSVKLKVATFSLIFEYNNK